MLLENPENYSDLLRALKRRIVDSRLRASLAVNQELIELYWQIGQEILIRIEHTEWGSKVIDRLSADLRLAFPEMTGLSERNLRYMRQFAEAYPGLSIRQQLVAQLPWGHNLALLRLVADPDIRLWYAGKVIEHGWSRAVLEHQVDSNLYGRQGNLLHNFDRTLPPEQSDLARQLFKDPYQFEFLNFTEAMNERAMERSLIDRIREFLLELGSGFAFVGNQYPLNVAGQDYYLDLLFYHVRLHAYIVIELKVEEFKPEFAGKMNFYLSAVDDLLRQPQDGPSIGLILCKTKNQVIVEYALRDAKKPIGVAQYVLPQDLPPALRDMLPSAEDLAEVFEMEDEEAPVNTVGS